MKCFNLPPHVGNIRSHALLRALTVASAVSCCLAADVIDVGSRRELFVDGHLVDRQRDVALQLHSPVPREVVIEFDEPWEGNISGYATVFHDGDRFRMYYRANHFNLANQKQSPEKVCYAVSVDGIHWTKPELGLFDHEGSKANNIVWQGSGGHNFTPFKDTNPDCAPDARYKALASAGNGLVPFVSPDGFHWTKTRDEPFITDGMFDSQNLAFYDNVRGQYVAFFRDFKDGIRDIKVCTSEDFLTWTKGRWLDYGDAPAEHLYTNAIVPYVRAPHLFVGFPKRFVPERKVDFHPISGVSDGVFMSSRDGLHWRRWREAFIRPGPMPERWVNRNNMTAWGVLVTRSDQEGAPDELSVYSSEGYYQQRGRLRRYTLRLDGFVSMHATPTGGEFVTKPLRFDGDRLELNYATSAVGSIRIELQDADGKPLSGFSLEDCDEIWGDHVDRTVHWKGKTALGQWRGHPVRLRFVMEDADLFAIRFTSDK